MRLLSWWILFTAAAIWLQQLVSGVDFLLPGLILCLQAGLVVWGFWLSLFWVVLQEGMGSLAFGTTVLWYGGIVGFFLLLRSYFEAENILFILLLSLFLGVWHFLLIRFMASLQDVVISNSILWQESMLQALLFPFAWIVARGLFKTYALR